MGFGDSFVLNPDELIKIIEEFKLSHIQSEQEARSKLIDHLIKWLGYPSQYCSMDFPVYASKGGTELPPQKADYVLFDDEHFADNKSRCQENKNWVHNHSLLIVEAKKPGEMPDSNEQAQFYSKWTRAVAYMYIDGKSIKGYILGNTTADIPIIQCDISDLLNHEEFCRFSYDYIHDLKENGIENARSLKPTQFRGKISSINGDLIPCLNDIIIITRHIVPIGDPVADGTQMPIPFEYLKQKKLIVLLSEAGQGKTFTLYQIYQEAKQQQYHPLFYRLQSLAEENALDLAVRREIAIDEKVVFIFDGFDEIPEVRRDKLVQTTKKAIELYSEILIIISSRTNVYSGQFAQENCFTLQNISKLEIDDFLDSSGVDVDQWNQQITMRKLERFCQNPFFLQEMLNIWQMNGALPNQSDLMDSITEARIMADVQRIRNREIKLSQHKSEVKKAFERIALIMQCMQCYSLTQDQIDRLYDSEQKRIMTCHGLWMISDDGEWQFAHNIFREYFAAVALSRMDLTSIKRFIAENDDCPVIKPSWYNVLAFLATSYHHHDLLKWIVEIQPELITSFEKERLDDDFLAQTMKRFLDMHKEKKTWADRNHSILNKLGPFCSVPDAVQYVIDELHQNQTNRHKQNLLRCLLEFTSFFNQTDRTKEIIYRISFDENEDIFVRADAFRVMRFHPYVFAEYVDKAADICRKTENEILRYEILTFIDNTGKAEQYIDIVIDIYDQYDHMESHFISLKLATDHILQNMQSLDAAIKVLEYLIKQKDRFYEEKNEKLLKYCCNVGKRYYDVDENLFLMSLLRLFDDKNRLFSRNVYSVISDYIRQTHAEALFVRYIISHQPIEKCGYILSQIINDPMTDTIAHMIETKSIDIRIVYDLVQRMCYGDTNQKKLIQIIFKYNGYIIQVSPPKDYAMERLAEHQRYFDALFNETLFDELVGELIELLGEEAEINDENYRQLWNVTGSMPKESVTDCLHALRFYMPQNQGIPIRDYKKYISDWNMFCYICAESAIQGYHVAVSPEQKNILVYYCKQYLENTDLETAIRIQGNQLSVSPLLYTSASLFNRFDIPVSEETALKLLIIPSEFFGKDNCDQLPECIVKKIEPGKLKTRIIELIDSNKWNYFTASAYIRYCLEHHMKECKDKIIQHLLDKEDHWGSTYWGLEYLQKLFGTDILISEVLSKCNDLKLLSGLSAKIPQHIHSEMLHDKLWEAYKNTSNISWLIELLKHGHPKALSQYYEKAKSLMTLPDMVPEPKVPEMTDAIREIDSSQCLSILIDLYMLSHEAGFTDRDAFGLRDSSRYAISMIAKSEYDQTHNAIEKALTGNDLDVDPALLDLLQSIENDRQFTNDQPISFNEAVMLC